MDKFFRIFFFLANCMEIYTMRKRKYVFVLHSLTISEMTLIDQETLAKLQRKPIVSNACIGCGACAAISGDVFRMSDDTGLSEVQTIDSYEGKDVDDSIMACPVSAISWKA